MLTENVIEVEKHVQAACDRAGRSRDEVTLIAVSKTKPVRDIEEVFLTTVRTKFRNYPTNTKCFRRIFAGI